MATTRWRSAFLVSALLLAACGGGGGNSPAPAVPAGMIGPAGGTVTGPAGSQVVIPAGALAQNTAIAITQSNNGAPALPAGVVANGQIFAFTPHGTTFQAAVTVTAPFDSTAVPAGTAPLLYKTNAAMSGWDAVAGTTTSGGAMSATVTSFSYFVVASPPADPRILGVDHYWRFMSFLSAGDSPEWLGDWNFHPAGTLHETYIYNPPSPVGDDARSAEIYAAESGETYWVRAQSPRGDPSFEGSRFGNAAELRQLTAYRVLDTNATLKMTITHGDLESFDGNVDPPSGWECPAEYVDPLPEDCQDSILGSIHFTAYLDEAGPDPERGLWFMESGATLQGWAKNWQFLAGSEQEYEIGSIRGVSNPIPKSKYEFDPDVEQDNQQLHARARLKQPVTVTIDLASLNGEGENVLEVGDVIVLEVEASAMTWNWRQRESWVNAYFRDPQSLDGGISLETTGLEPVEVPPQFTPVRSPRAAAPACPGSPDPEAGVLQFDAPRFSAPESAWRGAMVMISRSGGSRGPVSATLATSDGTAIAGRHYSPVNVNVSFADGESEPRLVRIPLLPDAEPNPHRALNLTLSDPMGCATLGPQATAELLILNDDRGAPPPPPVTYTIGGTVSGLAGSGLLLSSAGSSINPGNGPFTMPTPFDDGAAYELRITQQPVSPLQICTVTNATGTIQGANVTDIAVACVTPLPNGALDPDFGSGGKVTSSSLRPAVAMARQADGKLVVLSQQSKLSRYNADGTADLGFGTNGVVAVSFSNSGDTANAVALQADGKIVVAGRSIAGTFDDFGVARFNVDGTLDTGFGTSGKLSIDINGSFDQAMAVMIQADGKIVLAGNGGTATGVGIDSDFAAIRLRNDGALDSSFGAGGKMWANVGGRADLVSTAVLQPDGKILIAGRAGVDGGALPDTGLVRFTTLGAPDLQFGHATGSEGIDLSRSGRDHDEATDIALRADGRIIVAVVTQEAGIYRHTLARLEPDGSLDDAFGMHGIATNSFAAGGDFARAVAIQADGRIVTAGSTRPTDSFSDDLLLTRHDANGALDASFGAGGTVIVDFFGSADGAECLVIQPDGKIVAAGIARNASTNGLALVRVLP